MKHPWIPSSLSEHTAKGVLIASIVAVSVPSLALAQSLPTSTQAPGRFVRSGDPRRPTFKRVEQGVSDTGPLRVGVRDQGVDLLVPTGFRDVFEIQPGGPVPPGGAGGPGFNAASSNTQKQFARVNGAVIAVFPRSIYTPTEDGIVAEIPPGTIFYIGGLPKNMYTPSLGHVGGPDGGEPVSPLWADMRADTSVHAAGTERGGTSGPAPLTPANRANPSRRAQALGGTPEQHPPFRTQFGNRLPSPPTLPQGVMTDEDLRQRVVQALLQSAVKPAVTSTTQPKTPVTSNQADEKHLVDSAKPIAPQTTDETGNKNPDEGSGTRPAP